MEGKRWVLKKVPVEILRESRWELDKKSGTFHKVVMDHRDGKTIGEYKARLREDAQKQQRLHSEEEVMRQKEREYINRMLEKREAEADIRLQQLERMRKLQEQGIFVDDDPGGMNGRMRCGKCGRVGHNRSSRLCPLYGVRGEPRAPSARDDAYRDGTVKQDHSSGKLLVKIDAAKLQEKKKASELKVTLNLTKTERWQREQADREFQAHVAGRRSTGEQQPAPARQGRKAGSARVNLNNLLVALLQSLTGPEQQFGAFINPVADQLGDYYLGVLKRAGSSPMELSTMLKRAR
jgi:hypothetical protein